MILFRSWFALVLAFAAVVCAEESSSVLRGATSGFLTVERSPYTVEETIVVPEGKAFVVEAGVTLRFKQGTGLDISGGSFAVMGTAERPVVFEGADGVWNGISVTGNHRASLSYLEIDGAEIGMAVERGSVSMNEVDIRNTSRIALFAKDADVQVRGGAFNYNEGVAFWMSSGTAADVNGAAFFGNHVGVVLTDGAKLNISRVGISRNDVGLVSEDWSNFDANDLSVEGNKLGLVMQDNPPEHLREAVLGNDADYSQDMASVKKDLPEAPENAAAESFAKKRAAQEDLPTTWTLGGNVKVGGGYHAVWTATDENGDDYPNNFQVPGFFGDLSLYMLMRSSKGQSIEVTANLSSDKWTYFNPENVLVTYKDSLQRIALGDMFISGGNLYLAGVNLLGASYDIALFRNSAGKPMFVASAFGGEVHAPKLVGDRNKDIYKDYIEDGEAEPQQLLVGGKVRWNLDRRFNVTVGFIGSKDNLEDPLLRDGSSSNVNTAIPITSSKAVFADADWKLFPGNLQLNTQLAVGGADTTGVLLQRAINKVFSDAGLDVSNFAKLRKLMNNMSLVDRLSEAELEEIFGENSMMTASEMRSELRRNLEKAKGVLDGYGSEDVSNAEIREWNGENVAFTTSLRWALSRTLVEARMRFVGPDFFSAGSPDLLQNSREWFVSLDQKMMDFWNMGMSYKLDIENAAHGDEYNIFGFAEGSSVGVLPGAEDSWLKKHEQDANRTLYDHTAAIKNVFDIGQKAKVSVGYAMNYRTRSTNQRLFADYSLASGVYSDDWFRAGDGASIEVVSGDDTLKLDSSRWARYYALADKPYLATQFEERIMKHSVNLELKLSLPYNTLKVGGVWNIRRDMSRFEQDKLISDLKFSDETFGILGYYFHGGDYFEQSYPVSLNTVVGGVRNLLTVVPRHKVYNRDNMDDFEWRIAESLQVPLVKKFMDLSVMAVFRQEFLNRDEGDRHVREAVMDIGGSATLEILHLKNLTSSWTAGALYFNRPDLLSDEYFDLYGMVSVNYAF